MKKISILLIITIGLFACNKPENQQKEIDASAHLEKSVDSVLVLMTLDEKIGQLNLLTSDWDVTGPTMRSDYEDLIRNGQLGNIFNAFTVAYVRKLQKIAVEETRLKIPILFGYDVIHGHKTIFPIPLGESASWDLKAIENAARVSAIEAAASGINWTFAPMVDIARDPRWGRIMEGAGEDTYLGSEIAKARVKGFQGDDLSDPLTVMACAKHFAAYGAAQAGRDYHTVDISEITLRNVYLPPFKAAVQAGVGSFMNSFNELNGIPATANHLLLKKILRQEWGFTGIVVTDYTSINEMVPHGYAVDEKHAGEMAFNAGTEMDLQGSVYHTYMKVLLAENKINIEDIDMAVKNILRKKFELGLFDNPYKYLDEEREKKLIYAPEHLEAARDMARKSMVLLKNEKQLLPLGENIKKVALIGPLAGTKKEVLGAWRAAGDDNKTTSLLEALQQKNNIKVDYVKGCEIVGNDKSGFNNAVKAAKSADVVILALGESADMSGEAASRADISLPGVQTDLLKEIVKTGTPIVLVLMNGRPLVITEESELANAIIEAWFAGTMAGPAIVDVLWGDYTPSGKLTATFPRSIGQIPIFYNMKNTGRPMNEGKYTSKYLDEKNEALYPFGYGLSYTSFEYKNLQLSESQWSDSLIVSVEISNTGNFDGEEVVQLYLHQKVGSITRPVRELKAFKKIMLKKGETQTLKFKLTANDLMFYNAKLDYIAEDGNYEVFVGGNSMADLKADFIFKSASK
jgi:beta-glucosidase